MKTTNRAAASHDCHMGVCGLRTLYVLGGSLSLITLSGVFLEILT